jgi:hydroxyacylglutathione hydrolase
MKELPLGITIIIGEGMSSNVYLIEDKEKGILAIDAGASEVIKAPPAMTMLTHAHLDHTGGVGEGWNEVYMHKNDFAEGPYFKVPKQAKKINFEKVWWGEFVFDVLHTPGHTMGSICLYEKKKKILFSGDTLFADGIGRTDLGGDGVLMAKSLDLLDELTWKFLLPGHGEIAKR